MKIVIIGWLLYYICIFFFILMYLDFFLNLAIGYFWIVRTIFKKINSKNYF